MKLNINVDLSKVFNYLAIVSYIIKDDFLNYSNKTSKRFNRLKKLGQRLDNFLKKHELIQTYIKPKIEKTFNIKFKNPNLITIALFTPSTKNTSISLSNYIKKNHIEIYNKEKFDFISNFGDIAEGLATLGDFALKLAVTHILWNEGIIDKGIITKVKETIEKNSNLAKYCDQLHLYEYRIFVKSELFDPKPKTIDHIKGTLVETILGIFYFEKGLQETILLIKSLEDQQQQINVEK